MTPTYARVMLDKTGQFWTGSDFTDLAAYLSAYTAENYPAEKILQIKCECGSTELRIQLDDDEGCARRTCNDCGESRFVADSGEYWDDAAPGDGQCPCGHEVFNLGVGYSHREDGDIRWITVGARCVECGVLGAYVDWKIDYSPTAHLYEPS